MKILAIDIETTGIHPSRDQILQLGAVYYDSSKSMHVDKMPAFKMYVDNVYIKGDTYAINMNQHIFKYILENNEKRTKQPTKFALNDEEFQEGIICNISDLFSFFHYFLLRNKIAGNNITLAGKNIDRFDIPFLEHHIRFSSLDFNKRTFDPGVLFLDIKKDKVIPNLSECKRRAGLEDTVSHDALDDAKDIIRLIKKYYSKKYENRKITIHGKIQT